MPAAITSPRRPPIAALPFKSAAEAPDLAPLEADADAAEEPLALALTTLPDAPTDVVTGTRADAVESGAWAATAESQSGF